MSAAVACGLSVPFTVKTIGDTRFVLLPGQHDALLMVDEIAVAMLGARGIATVSEVGERVGLGEHPGLVKAILNRNNDFRWLDSANEWFWAPRMRGNRIVSRVRQILNQVPEVSADLLHAGLLWKEQLCSGLLPLPILLELCVAQDWCEVMGNNVRCKDPAIRARAEHSAENRVLGILRGSGGALRIEDFQELRIREGITGGAISVILTTSSLIQNIDGVCRLPGTTHSPSRLTGLEPVAIPVIQENATRGCFLGTCNPLAPDFVQAAGERIRVRASELGLRATGNPWSLIELGWTKAGLAKLREWGQRGWVNLRRVPGSGYESFGLIFLAYCMEITRTEAHEGEMWPQIFDSLGQMNRELLFAARGIARPRVLDELERAGRNLNLRHVFGKEGTQSRLRSVYLQFGVSDAGWHRLPWWLSGQGIPITAQDLLTKESNLFSQSFADLWHTLQEFRWGSVSRDEAFAAIATNPWIVNVGAETALDLAASHREVQQVDETEVPANEYLLASPRLSTAGDEPCFEVALSSKLPSWMTAPRYILVLGKYARWPVVRSADGDYTIETERAVLPPTEGVVQVDLLLEGASALPEPLNLEFYAHDEEVAAFDLSTGRKLDIWEPIDTNRPCAMLCAADIVLEPSSPEWRILFGGERILWLYRRGLPASLTASLAGEMLWMPVEQPPPKAVDQPEQVVRCSGGSWGSAVRVHFQLAPGIEPRKLRIGDQTLLATKTSDGAFQFDNLRLTPEIDVRTSAVLEFFCKGQLKRTPIRFETGPAIGAAVESGGKWKVLDGEATLDRGELVGRRIFVRPPSAWGGSVTPIEDWALVEGSNFCARPRSVDRDFQECLFGVGQPLELGIGPYNRSGEERIRLAKSVTDSGLIASAQRIGNCWQIAFRRPIEPGLAHAVWIWTKVEVAEISGTWTETTFETGGAALSGEPLAFALAFNGNCVGTAFTEPSPYPSFCDLVRISSDWVETASWLRWFRAPLLDTGLRHAIADRIRDCWFDTFWTWLNPDGVVGRLQQSDPRTERWQYTVRRFFERWRPTPAESGQLLRRFELLTGDPHIDLAQAWERYDELLDIHPALLASTAIHGTADIFPTFSPHERRMFLAMLVNLLLDLAPAAGAGDTGRAFTRLLEQSAQSLKVDAAFIEKSLLPDAVRLFSGTLQTARNLRIALAVRPFRRWLAARLIHERI